LGKLRAPPRRAALALLLLLAGAWVALHPQRFVALWLTPDQQGRIWFDLGNYERAERAFEDPRWRGISAYAAGNFTTAARYFGQYQDAESLLGRANALAHAREYIPARRAYLELQARYPDHPAPPVNLPIVEKLIEANQRMSESQQGEAGDMSAEQDEGPRSSEGDERLVLLEREQLGAEDLLRDPALTDMWLRQVQRDPSEFLANKFYLQLERGDTNP
jgi:Ca-activated chloride channel family protein